jgi:LuxR family maltose regulon positive regulatory protein
VHFGLGRVYYEWNDLEAAQRHGQLAWQLARQIEFNDLYIANEVFLARLKLAQGRPNEAAVILARAEQAVRQHKFANRMPAVAAAQALCLLRQGDLAAAAQLAGEYDLPLIQARVRLAQGDPTGALAMLDPLRRQAEAKGWESERLKVIVPQALAWQALGEKDQALQLLAEALRLAEPGGLIRTFIDEGAPMARLLAAAPARKMASDYVSKLHSACQAEAQKDAAGFDQPPSQPLNEPLSPRELEVLQLIAQGLSNQEISQRLFLALDTVKGHNRRIYEKLGVQRRTEAVARARELGLFF